MANFVIFWLKIFRLNPIAVAFTNTISISGKMVMFTMGCGKKDYGCEKSHQSLKAFLVVVWVILPRSCLKQLLWQELFYARAMIASIEDLLGSSGIYRVTLSTDFFFTHKYYVLLQFCFQICYWSRKFQSPTTFYLPT